MRVNLRWRSGHRAGRARLSETAGSPATHRLSWPNAFASHNGSRPDRVQLRPGSCGLGETRPTRAAARHYQKSFSLGRHLKLTRMGGCLAAAGHALSARLPDTAKNHVALQFQTPPYVDVHGRLPDR
jgi:hypothetical protein